MKTQDYKLTKKNASSPVMFPAFETEDGMLCTPQGLPLLIGDEVVAAGFKLVDGQVKIDDLPDDLKQLVLRVGDNRGHIVERRETYAERKAREKAESDKENAFLKSHGYTWKKSNFYCSGDIGDIVDYWALIDPDGHEVVGKTDGGGWIKEVGSVKSILTDLGYYGQEAIDEKAEKKQIAAKRSEARKIVDKHFKNSEPHTPTPELEERTLTLVSISKTSRTCYAITEESIWRLVYNGMDGDDWSYNNYSMYIASCYDYNKEVAEAIEYLKSD